MASARHGTQTHARMELRCSAMSAWNSWPGPLGLSAIMDFLRFGSPCPDLLIDCHGQLLGADGPAIAELAQALACPTKGRG